MKINIAAFFLAVGSVSYAQELVQTDYEKGYIKNGVRYSVWQYFNADKEPELSINHSNGKVLFISRDTSDFVILKNGEWVFSKLDIHPVPITGTINYYRAIMDTLNYPTKDYDAGLKGKVVAAFEVDTLGRTTNFQIISGIGVSCDSAVLASLKLINWEWIPARVNKKKYSARLALGFEFKLEKSLPEYKEFPYNQNKVKLLEEFYVKKQSATNEDLLFLFAEKSAEPVGGLEEFYKWVGKNLRYPAHARRYGIQGKVFVKFFIEKDGTITNPELVKGCGDEEINQEAIRIVSIMPKWNAGERSGRKARQAFTLPINFMLAN